MWPSVQAAWDRFSEPLESRVPYMYLDILGKVTTGVGNLIDSIPAAQALSWRDNTTNALVDKATIGANWNLVKSRKDLAPKGGGYFKGVSNIHLDPADIDALVSGKLSQNDRTLSARFPGYASWPADAQLALNSMAWAMGANFNYPLFAKAVNALTPNFKEAAAQSYIPDNPQKSMAYPPISNQGLRPRNVANQTLFLNAQAALDKNIPHDVLQWAEGVLETAEGAAGKVAEAAGKGGGVIAGILVVLGLGYAGYKVYQASKARQIPGIAETHQLQSYTAPHDEHAAGPAHAELRDTDLLGDRLERLQS